MILQSLRSTRSFGVD